MTTAYDLLQKQAETNRQIYTLLRFACKCEHATALSLNSYEAATVFLSAKIPNSVVYTLSEVDENVKKTLEKINKDSVKLELKKLGKEIEPTDLLYIDTPAEGNFRAGELEKYHASVRKYIILPNTVTYAHKAANNIKLADHQTPIGLVFGINHFIQTHDNWFILEHDDIDPGITVLVNKDTVSC
jgi:hypothetical protein